MSPLPEHLQQATRSRTEKAEKRARAALSQLTKAGEPVAFTAVARKAAVSTDFLYKHPELLLLIERHRTKGGHIPGTRPVEAKPPSASAAVRALSARLSQRQQAHREEIARLRKALQIAQGENLELRRRLAQFAPT
ncbi:Arc/MetJ-type ribon-helix-helix transcriptional regulator [Kitasatospora sp. MAA19]|uniref:DUF6262 family protein n=1 Tax=Kitasatospora sp. MAA19 TaxID=3035090 RepID=UPI0024748924|nr:DUF6262 family protein [Kitasatospora sp. MAA19]MDH6710644.1 Arc/MetJ-type ribon-helix-helix transcriptional regulator [Kitasatospora sp. MAA19]